MSKLLTSRVCQSPKWTKDALYESEIMKRQKVVGELCVRNVIQFNSKPCFITIDFHFEEKCSFDILLYLCSMEERMSVSKQC